jgi:formylglycine-generating enzyme required for sulfatase activity
MATKNDAKEEFKKSLIKVNHSIVSLESILSEVISGKFVPPNVLEVPAKNRNVTSAASATSASSTPFSEVGSPEETPNSAQSFGGKARRSWRIKNAVFLAVFLMLILGAILGSSEKNVDWKRFVLAPEQHKCVSALVWNKSHFIDYLNCITEPIEESIKLRHSVPLPKIKPPVPIRPKTPSYPVGQSPGTQFRDCFNCPIMVVMPKGSFHMGDLSENGNINEKPVHRVVINYLFAVGKFKITVSQWNSMMGESSVLRANKREVISSLSWNDTKAFIEKLNDRLGLRGLIDRYRLLSEAEFEYVARAGTTTKYYFGNIDRVGKQLVNAFGLNDVHGIVSEWVEDCWHENYVGAPTDGSAWTSIGCRSRVQRGGASLIRQSSKLKLVHASSHERDHNHSGYGSNGFRVASPLQK